MIVVQIVDTRARVTRHSMKDTDDLNSLFQTVKDNAPDWVQIALFINNVDNMGKAGIKVD